MKSRPKKPTPERKAQLIAELRRDKIEKDNSYRSKALKLFPHVCARCAREFEGQRLRELTVHHRDHNHDNNPPDGKNWELLCLYCHDNEHEKTLKNRGISASASKDELSPSIFSQFEGLDKLITPDDE
jgi:5-methylcytosine-specific restriction endonuclease McrA